MFLELLKKYRDQYDIKIFAYVLMPNHLHLLVEMASTAQEGQPAKFQEMSDFMHNLNNAYTKYFNSTYERKGHLFRERFKAAIIEKEQYLLKMTVYLHLNPQKLRLVPDASVYAHSTLPLYLGKAQSPVGLDLSREVSEVMSLLGLTLYKDLITVMSSEESELIHKRLNRGGIVGSEAFVERVRLQAASYQSQPDTEETATPLRRRYRLVITAAGLLVLVAAGAAARSVFFYMHKKPLPSPGTQPQPLTTPPPQVALQGIPVPKQTGLEKTAWEIKVVPAAGGIEAVDTLDFADATFRSVKMASRGFKPSHYSLTAEEGNRFVWETMQSSSSGTVTWRGEIENGRMTGVMSLRQEGNAPQDFSFTSIRYRRNE